MRHVLGGKDGIKETKMFGAFCFMLNGNMCVGVCHVRLIARVGVEADERGLQTDECMPMDITGEPMRG